MPLKNKFRLKNQKNSRFPWRKAEHKLDTLAKDYHWHL